MFRIESCAKLRGGECRIISGGISALRAPRRVPWDLLESAHGGGLQLREKQVGAPGIFGRHQITESSRS